MNTSISDAIKELYTRCPEFRFADDLEYYMEHGYVLSGPDFFLMAEDQEEGWFIYLAAGTGALKTFAHLMPHWRSKIGWSRQHRGKQIAWHNMTDILRTIGIHDEDTAYLQKRN